jgi:uncharacterized protein (DUF433 family)
MFARSAPFTRRALQSDVRYQPAYSIAEAAHYLRMPRATLRSWVAGRWYPVGGAKKKSRPLVHPDDPEGRYLSFINLVEAHILAAILRRHGVKLPKVRRALDYVKRHFVVERPLIDETFQTDGMDLFVERYGEMINASREGQQAMRDILSLYLQRIERDGAGLPVKLYPFTRDTAAQEPPRPDPRLIVMSPLVSYGRPVIRGTGIPVAAIYERYKAGDSIAELADQFRLDPSAVEEAIRCEAA